MRLPGEIGTETIGRGEAGTFADKDKAEAGCETETDGVADRDSALLHQSEWSDGPACDEELREKVCEQGNDIALDGQCGEAIGDDDGKVAGGGLQLGSGVRVEGPAKNRLAEIGSPVGGICPELEHRDGGFFEEGELGVEALRERGKVKQSVYGVACPSMGELEVEHFSRGDAMAGGGQGYSGRSEVAEVETGSWIEGHRSVSSQRVVAFELARRAGRECRF